MASQSLHVDGVPVVLDNTDNDHNRTSNSVLTDTQVEPVIIDEVLCYIQNHSKRTTRVKIVEVVARSFSPDDIMKARDVLSNDSRISKLKNRRNTNARMRHEQTTDDIVGALMELDQLGVETNFVAKNLFVLPKCDPKDLDPFSTLQKLIALEERVTFMESTAGETKAEVLSQMDAVKRLSVSVQSNDDALLQLQLQARGDAVDGSGGVMAGEMTSEGGDLSPKVGSTQPGVGVSAATKRPGVVLLPDEKSSATQLEEEKEGGDKYQTHEDAIHQRGMPNSDVSQRSSAEQSASRLDAKASRPSYANVVRKGGDTEVRGKQMTNEGALPSEQKNEFNSDDTSWIKIQTRNKIGRNDRKDGQKRQTQKRMIHGSVRSDIVHGAPLPKRDFFISRVVKSTTDEQMLNYVRNKGIRSVEIKRMSNDEAIFKSFKLTVSIDEKDKVMQESMWPYGLCVQRWRDRNHRTNNEKDRHLKKNGP